MDGHACLTRASGVNMQECHPSIHFTHYTKPFIPNITWCIPGVNFQSESSVSVFLLMGGHSAE